MVDHFTSCPLELPPSDPPFSRADLIFYGIDHSGSSFEARLFLDDPDADHAADRGRASYVDSFFIFGHGGCFGDVGHCDVPLTRDPFDLRPAHQLLPAIRVVTVTDAIRDRVRKGATSVSVTIVAHTAGDKPNGVLAFETLRLATYA
jgi:hypothetical protein